MFNPKLIPGSLLFTLAFLSAGSVSAVVLVQRDVSGQAAAQCDGALPAYDAQLRKRPLSVQNEGTAPIFVTCTYASQSGITQFMIYARSRSGTEAMLTCTGVNGADSPDASAARYSTKSIALPADGNLELIKWYPADFNTSAEYFPYPVVSLSCVLPPGVGLNHFYLVYKEDVGN